MRFFDANGPIGFSRRHDADFEDARALVRHMDRLGIASALAWNVQARDHHPATGNRMLMAELDEVDPGRRRLLPSFVIAPSMLYERGSADELCGALAAGTVRAVRLFPASLRHRLRHVEPLIERIAPHKPVILLDVREVADDREVIEFAERFPSLPVVCLHGMWPTFFNFSLLDLLRRCPNILVDNSVLHCHGVMEKICRDFGPGRVVFGTHWKSHNGASMAHVLRSGLDADGRERVAHGTLEQLLAVRGGGAVAPAPESLWGRFCAGGNPGGEIVDAHGHLGSQGWWPLEERELEQQIPVALRRMDAMGVRAMIVSGQHALFGHPVEGNRILEAAAGVAADRLKGYLVFNPFYGRELEPLLDGFFSRSFFVGFKTLCDYWQVPVTDPRFRPAYQYAHEHRLPILLHTWSGGHDSPAMLRDIVGEYRDAFFILGHSGGNDAGRAEAEDLAAANPNVFLEWCGSFCARRLWEQTLAIVDPRRIVFGSDGLHHDLGWELGRLLSLDAPERLVQSILGANMNRVLAHRR